MKVFVDSDVVISSLISSAGASHLLFETKDDIEVFVSSISVKELEKVIRRLNIDSQKLKSLIKTRFKTVKLEENLRSIKNRFRDYTLDINDAHIVAGAKGAKVKFLISYNIRHFRVDKILKDFNIIVLTPGKLLQYLRSKSLVLG